MHGFDPNAASVPGSGLFGLPHGPDDAQVHVFPAPFDATASYRKGAARGPEAIRRASHQVDLFDLATGRPYERGIWMAEDDGRIAALNEEATPLADRVIAAGGRVAGDPRLTAALGRVDALGAEVNAIVRAATEEALGRERLPVLVGGDHATPFGAIDACARRHRGLGLLHFDAHADLRIAYEGFTWSHASILHNVVERLDGVARVVQVGIRDLCEEEHDAIRDSNGRVRAVFDRDWARARLEGRDLRALVRAELTHLPDEVYVTFDVDGLDPALCPNTGTPVPGGLNWNEAGLWLDELAASGRRVVGLDLNEVSPGDTPEGEDAWDAMVGARLLYRLIATALRTR